MKALSLLQLQLQLSLHVPPALAENGPPLSCTSWTRDSCLNRRDEKVATFTNISGPRSCCDQCGLNPSCRAWALYSGAAKENGTVYCDLYARDTDRFPCRQGVTSNPSRPPAPPGPAPTPRPVPPPPKPKPGTQQLDVLLIVVDDLRYQFGSEGPGVKGPGCASASRATFFPGCSGMHTPNLDALAARPGSTLFSRNYVQQAVCAASRASVLTSRRPDASHWGDGYWRKTAGNWSTLPETFRRSGYLTRGAGKIFHGGIHSGDFAAGLGADDQGPGPNTYSWSLPYFHAEAAMKHYPYGDCKGLNDIECSVNSWKAVSEAEEQEHPLEGTVLADHTISSLASIAHKRRQKMPQEPIVPFFVGVGFHRPHLPFVFPAKNLDLYPRGTISQPERPTPPQDMPAVAWSNWVSIELKSYRDIHVLANESQRNASGFGGHALGLPGVQMPPVQQIDMRRAYYSAVTHTDEQIGRVLRALDTNGLRQRTIVCFFTDHGWSLGEHGKWAKHTNFELDVHAPWILAMPSQAVNVGRSQSLTPFNMVAAFTEHVDIMPTLLEVAAGVVIPSCPSANTTLNLCTMGRSRVSLLKPLGSNDGRGRKPIDSNDNAAFSQYERPYAGTNGNQPVMNVSYCSIGMICTVGYSMVGVYAASNATNGATTALEGEYRFTVWVGYNTPGNALRPDWSDVAGIELYRHNGSAVEDRNLAGVPTYSDVVSSMLRRLRIGPTTGGGWGQATWPRA